jgi:hypothetical protein
MFNIHVTTSSPGVAFAGGSHKIIIALPLWIVWTERTGNEGSALEKLKNREEKAQK